MSEAFNYLKHYIRKTGEGSSGPNDFWPVFKEELIKSEEELGIPFPQQLRTFYQSIGYGFLTHPHTLPKGYSFFSTNRINSPNMISSIVLKGPNSGLILDEAYELLQPSDLPFFEMYDSTHFLVMKPNSPNPNAVWTLGFQPIKIEDSFEKFIWRLYYESPDFYGSIIEEAINMDSKV